MEGLGSPAPSGEQNVRAEGGFAYGVVGADIHVFGDGVPVYLLESWRPPPELDPEFLTEMPSRMLNSRFAVVEFTGREQELHELAEWRDRRQRLAAFWLHGPGGQGKSRLAAQFCAMSASAGWKVVVATEGPGTLAPPPGSQDLTVDGAVGLLVLVDYADRWPLSHLLWLFRNTIFHRADLKARILLIARTYDVWPVIRARLADIQAGAYSRLLTELPPDDPGQRAQMFDAARDGFAGRYGFADTSVIVPLGPLDHPDYGLTLTLHMAALVAVDAHLNGRRAPADMAGLTLYLLDREHAHWARLFGDGTHELAPVDNAFQTPPDTMNRMVFTAALTGPQERAVGTAVLDFLGGRTSTLRDHAVCYPPADPFRDTVLEPLYPDRLTEDFLALTIPGHPAEYPAQAWAVPMVSGLLDRAGGTQPPVAWIPRSITFLASAAERWPHLGPACLFPLLHADPELAIAAGSAALTALSRLEGIDPDLLEAIEDTLPEGRHVDLDIGIADVVTRVGRNTLAGTEDPTVRGRVHYAIGSRESWAGRHQRALDALLEAEVAFQIAVAEEPGTYEESMADVLLSIAAALMHLGRRRNALAVTERAISFLELHATNGKELSLAIAYNNLSSQLGQLERVDEAVTAAREAARLLRSTNQDQHGQRVPALSAALGNLGRWLSAAGNYDAALAPLQESLKIRWELAAGNHTVYEPELAEAMLAVAVHMAKMHADRALGVAEEAVTLWRSLAAANPTAFEANLARALMLYSLGLTRADRNDEALAASQQAVEVLSRQAAADPVAFDALLANAQSYLSRCLSEIGRHQEAVATIENALTTFERLRETGPETFTPAYLGALVELCLRFSYAGRHEEALTAVEKALTLLLPLAEANPRWSRDVANVYFKRSVSLVALGRHEEGLTDRRHSAAILRQAVHDEPALTYDLAGALEGLVELLIETGRHLEARAVQKEYDAIIKSAGSYA